MVEYRVNIQSEDVLFRIWLYRAEGLMKGVIDLMRKLPNSSLYSDAAEALIGEDKYGMIRLMPRERGKDIPIKWYSIIETNLLVPVAMKTIRPYQQHVHGEGKLSKVIDLKFNFSELELQDVKIISPREYCNRAIGLPGDNIPDHYGVSSPIVFLCHSSKDKPFVRQLATKLRENDVDVWFDEQDILVGQSFIDRMQEGIRKSDFVAVILTPNFLNGPWANRELQMALNHEVQVGRVKVLPILRKTCEIPDALGIKSFADFRGDKFEKGFKSFVKSIFGLLPDEDV